MGRDAVRAVARGFMNAFPDMVVRMDEVRVEGERAVYAWTLTGSNTGPGGTGRRVRISGQEVWTMAEDGLIGRSEGSFDEAEYRRQLEGETP
jgi:predicted ester cyclase